MWIKFSSRIPQPKLLQGLVLLIMVGLVWSLSQVSLAAAETAAVENQISSSARVWADEPYSQVFTNDMAQELAVWVLETYPDLPFKEPQVQIHEDGIDCSGVVEILGMDVAASARILVFLEGGKVNGQIEALHVAGIKMPRLLQNALGDVRDYYEDVAWEIVVTKVELREGELLVEGTYK